MSGFKFKDQVWEHPRRYLIEDNGDGTVEIIPNKGKSIEDGTPLNAENLNKIGIKIISSSDEPEGLNAGDIWLRESQE